MFDVFLPLAVVLMGLLVIIAAMTWDELAIGGRGTRLVTRDRQNEDTQSPDFLEQEPNRRRLLEILKDSKVLSVTASVTATDSELTRYQIRSGHVR